MEKIHKGKGEAPAPKKGKVPQFLKKNKTMLIIGGATLVVFVATYIKFVLAFKVDPENMAKEFFKFSTFFSSPAIFASKRKGAVQLNQYMSERSKKSAFIIGQKDDQRGIHYVYGPETGSQYYFLTNTGVPDFLLDAYYSFIRYSQKKAGIKERKETTQNIEAFQTKKAANEATKNFVQFVKYAIRTKDCETPAESDNWKNLTFGQFFCAKNFFLYLSGISLLNLKKTSLTEDEIIDIAKLPSVYFQNHLLEGWKTKDQKTENKNISEKIDGKKVDKIYNSFIAPINKMIEKTENDRKKYFEENKENRKKHIEQMEMDFIYIHNIRDADTTETKNVHHGEEVDAILNSFVSHIVTLIDPENQKESYAYIMKKLEKFLKGILNYDFLFLKENFSEEIAKTKEMKMRKIIEENEKNPTQKKHENILSEVEKNMKSYDEEKSVENRKTLFESILSYEKKLSEEKEKNSEAQTFLDLAFLNKNLKEKDLFLEITKNDNKKEEASEIYNEKNSKISKWFKQKGKNYSELLQNEEELKKITKKKEIEEITNDCLKAFRIDFYIAQNAKKYNEKNPKEMKEFREKKQRLQRLYDISMKENYAGALLSNEEKEERKEYFNKKEEQRKSMNNLLNDLKNGKGEKLFILLQNVFPDENNETLETVVKDMTDLAKKQIGKESYQKNLPGNKNNKEYFGVADIEALRMLKQVWSVRNQEKIPYFSWIPERKKIEKKDLEGFLNRLATSRNNGAEAYAFARLETALAYMTLYSTFANQKYEEIIKNKIEKEVKNGGKKKNEEEQNEFKKNMEKKIRSELGNGHMEIFPRYAIWNYMLASGHETLFQKNLTKEEMSEFCEKQKNVPFFSLFKEEKEREKNTEQMIKDLGERIDYYKKMWSQVD